MKLISIVGARPQFIKAAAVSRAIENHNSLISDASRIIKEIVVHTGQHYDHNMSQVFFDQLEIRKPDYNLGVGSGTHGKMTGTMLEKIENVLLSDKPDWVLVYGDTNSTLAGALAAVKLHIPVAHVEAGLRSFNRQMPEEINRLITDHVSTILFCPTKTAVRNLKAEGIGGGSSPASNSIRSSVQKNESSISHEYKSLLAHELPQTVALVGDVMYDSVLHNIKLAEQKSKILKKLNLEPKGYALTTVHRAENTDNNERLKSIFMALDQISSDGLTVIVPLHPRTRKLLKGIGLEPKYVRIIEPVSYLDLLLLEKQAKIILTDSGGLQKEAYWMKVPCITLRDETEWVETVNAGWNILAGSDCNKIAGSVIINQGPLMHDELFGDGKSAEKIIDILSVSVFGDST
jgi:UDP-N-acetylglucosamine 2-epimerase